MIVSNLRALEGMVWGLALGDALNHMRRFRKPPYLLHSAVGTWFLSVFESVFDVNQLETKLEILAAPHYGLALRGESSGLVSTLLKAAREHPVQNLVGDILPCLVPLSFCIQEETKLIERIIKTIHVTHWHPRVISAGALLIGALRALLVDPNLSMEGQLEQGERLADKTLQLLYERKEADTPQAVVMAYQALRHHIALAKGASDPMDLQVPLGFDARDCPEQLVLLTLALVDQNDLQGNLVLALEQGGTSDVSVPLLMTVSGLRGGSSIFLKEWFDALEGKELWSRHMQALAQRDFYFPCLVEEEIKLTRHEQKLLKELDDFQVAVLARSQLNLFEEPVIQRKFARSQKT